LWWVVHSYVSISSPQAISINIISDFVHNHKPNGYFPVLILPGLLTELAKGWLLFLLESFFLGLWHHTCFSHLSFSDFFPALPFRFCPSGLSLSPSSSDLSRWVHPFPLPLKYVLSTQNAFFFFFSFLVCYWGLNSEPTPWATPPTLFLWWVFSR
jgi:hypothetical protein